MKSAWRKTIRRILARRFVRETFVSSSPLVVTRPRLSGRPMKFMTHRKDEILGAMLRREDPFCPVMRAEIAWLKAQIRPNDFVLDAGGNIGLISIAMALAEPAAQIVAFEPDPTNFGLLQMNLVLNGCRNVHGFNLAMGNEDGLIQFYRSPDNFGDHRSSRPTATDLNENGFRQLDTPIMKVRASAFLEKCFPGCRLNLVKIDTQGADFEILGDILPLLTKDGKVTVEYSPFHLATHGTTRDDAVKLLSEFRSLQLIRPDLQSGYTLQETNAQAMGRYFDEQCDRYREHYDLVLLK